MLLNRRHVSALLGTLLASSVPIASHALTANISEFTVNRNGALFFTDPFSDGNEPPSAPNFFNGNAASYLVQGTIPNTAESGGVLQINSANGVVTTNAIGLSRIETRARLLSNIDPADFASGLKSDDTLSLRGLFSLTSPTGVNNPQYAVRFTDAAAGAVHQTAQIQVLLNAATAQTEVRFLWQDFDADTITVLGSAPLAPPAGANEILLGIDRPNTANNEFFGSFAYVIGGVAQPLVTFGNPALLFQGENFVRAEFNVSDGFIAAIPEPSTYALMLAGLGLVGYGARRRKRV